MGNENLEISRKEYAVVAAILLVVFAAILAGAAVMAYFIYCSPQLAGMVYEKVTLPPALHFMIGLKGLFQAFVGLICCVPVAAVYYIMLRALSKYSRRCNE
ncbi:hypothetical protein GPL15_01795 [Clostridium sp. MCC353]|uniref:hypothetical protein n=1 Tax=Clostridium sp. MCC353 TaxID=2592646 RepID=UPI001C00B369|nr:hypothetical protein [Clostridium sp. MCC353]MBT9775240.1 hypothetical protein [Clostridium sp. MCC353]